MPLTGFEEVTTHPPEVLSEAKVVRRVIEPRTAANPILSPQIEAATGFGGPQVRALVHVLREQGVPICSTSKGYWMARTPDELETTLEHLRQRSRSLQTVIVGLEKARANMAPQGGAAQLGMF